MMTIGKGASSKVSIKYLEEEYTHERGGYYHEEGKVAGVWSGELAIEFELRGEVEPEHFERLADGRDADSGEQQLVRHQTPRKIAGADGRERMSEAHRAGWDFTVTAPKSISLAAIVGKDKRIFEAHERANAAALKEIEKYAQARIGGNAPAQTTGKMLFASFDHTAARPDRETKLAAPNLHTHNFGFNLTITEKGKVKPLQPLELYRTKQLATETYRATLATELQRIGYEIEIDKETGAPEIKGVSREYREAASPRRAEVLMNVEAMRERLARQGVEVKDARTLQPEAAVRNRGSKIYDREEMRARYQEMDARFGGQAHAVVRAAQERERDLRGRTVDREESRQRAGEAVTYAIEKATARASTSDIRLLLVDALRQGMGEAMPDEIRAEVAAREERGELAGVVLSRDESRRTTTEKLRQTEQHNIEIMRAGQGSSTPISGSIPEPLTTAQEVKLNDNQRVAVTQILVSNDRVQGLQSNAGTEKTTVLTAIKEAAERAGYEVHGVASTTRAAKVLGESGIETRTLQRFLRERQEVEAESQPPRLLVIDEASRVSTRSVAAIFARARRKDKVLLVGDSQQQRQQHAVEARSPFEQFKAHGMSTAVLEKTIRQPVNPSREVVERPRISEVKKAVDNLIGQGRVIEVADDGERLSAIAKDYCAQPERTLVVSPTEKERMEINRVIHEERRAAGQIGKRDYTLKVLVAKDSTSGVERTIAGTYEAGDRLRFKYTSRLYGVRAGEYAKVEATNIEKNTLTVRFEEGKRKLNYDAKRLQGVSVYREEERRFAERERIQFRAPDDKRRIVSGELGTLERVEGKVLTVRLDRDGREVSFTTKEKLHVDYGYAVESYPAQGQTITRVIVTADTRESDKLLNLQLAQVITSRCREDARIYTNSIQKLGTVIERQIEKNTRLEKVKRTPSSWLEKVKRRSDSHEKKEQSGRVLEAEGARRRTIKIGNRGERLVERFADAGSITRPPAARTITRPPAARTIVDGRGSGGDHARRDGENHAGAASNLRARQSESTSGDREDSARASTYEQAVEGGRARTPPVEAEPGAIGAGARAVSGGHTSERAVHRRAASERGGAETEKPAITAEPEKLTPAAASRGDESHLGILFGRTTAEEDRPTFRGAEALDHGSSTGAVGCAPAGRAGDAFVSNRPDIGRASDSSGVDGRLRALAAVNRSAVNQIEQIQPVPEPLNILDEVKLIFERREQAERLSLELVQLANEYQMAAIDRPLDVQVQERMRAELIDLAAYAPSPAQMQRDDEIAHSHGESEPNHENALESLLYAARHDPDRNELLSGIVARVEAMHETERRSPSVQEHEIGWERETQTPQTPQHNNDHDYDHGR